ncbi:MAG: hypothetical protein GY856_30020, partial [bacterium]|nr:hypothetical protein [bacterium]
NVGTWHSCTCGSSSDGCGATNGYMQWLAADDDDGNISNGTPHMTALYDAWNRHEIACSTPTPTNSGCSGGPTGTATLSATPGNNQVALSWTAVAGASNYWVFRTEGHAGCDYNKALIHETTSLSYTDDEVANGREYYYNVVAVGTSDACFGPVSNCATVTPSAATDVWSKDKPWDTGLEPDPATTYNNMWESEDIWVRNDATPGPHQNPEVGQVNYVWVNVRNRSDVPAYNMPIEVWGTMASTGLVWPDDWSQLGTDTVPVVPANGLVQATVTWTPDETGHYCLLVRHDTAQDPLTFPEIWNPNDNARNNNNIVWKNVNIVDLLEDPVQEVRLIVRNMAQADLAHNLVFQEVAQGVAAKATNGEFLDRGKVTVHLPNELAQRWDAEGNKGDGVVKIDENTVEITDSARSAMEVGLRKDEEFTIILVFEDTVKRDVLSEDAKPVHYTLRVVQEEIRAGKTEAMGGVTYQIIAPPQ